MIPHKILIFSILCNLWWTQLYPLAGVAPEGTPSCFGFYEPELYLDTIDLFGSRDSAKAYKKEHGIKGKIRKQKDRSFAIESRIAFIQRDQEIADLISNGAGNDGVVISAKVQAPAMEPGESGKLRFGPEKIAPLSFWQRLTGAGVPEGGRYNHDGYYLGPEPIGSMPLAGSGSVLKIGATFSKLISGLKGTTAKQGIKFVKTGGNKVMEIYRKLRKSGWNLQPGASSGGVKTLVNPNTGEKIMFRQSQSGGYSGYDTIFQPIGGGKNVTLFFNK